jgi:hypothetical protein
MGGVSVAAVTPFLSGDGLGKWLNEDSPAGSGGGADSERGEARSPAPPRTSSGVTLFA